MKTCVQSPTCAIFFLKCRHGGTWLQLQGWGVRDRESPKAGCCPVSLAYLANEETLSIFFTVGDFAEDLYLVPSTHDGQLTTTCRFTSRESSVSSLREKPHTCSTHSRVHTYPHIHTHTPVTHLGVFVTATQLHLS